jgi:hypothetical protein
MAADIFNRFPAAVHAMAARCKLSFAIRPGLSQEDRRHTKEITKERHKNFYSSSADAIKVGVGRNRGSSTSAPSPSASALLSSSRSLPSRSPHSDTSLYVSSSAWAGTSLPTSVVDRKSSTTLLHLSSASRSQTFQRLFHLPVSFLTSAHKVFCCSFHSAHSLKRWSHVCVSLAHHQH